MATRQASEDTCPGTSFRRSGGWRTSQWWSFLGQVTARPRRRDRGTEIWVPDSACSPPLCGVLAAHLPPLGLSFFICKQETRASSQGYVEMK